LESGRFFSVLQLAVQTIPLVVRLLSLGISGACFGLEYPSLVSSRPGSADRGTGRVGATVGFVIAGEETWGGDAADPSGIEGQ